MHSLLLFAMASFVGLAVVLGSPAPLLAAEAAVSAPLSQPGGPDPSSLPAPRDGAAADPAANAQPIAAPDASGAVVAPSPDGDGEPLEEVTVYVARSKAEALEKSAEAVQVVDTRRAQRQTADLGEVLARTPGVAVRRDGGLGSDTRFSLNGLYDDQIRFFLDGVPLDLAGFPFGVGNVPVNWVERVEIYRGVVPVRFGADALGGAVNLVTDEDYDTGLGLSYQVGSFGTHRATLDGRYRQDATGLVARGAVFFDRAANDYEVDVEVPNEVGRPVPARVPRFHDGYVAYGGALEGGLVDAAWAKRLTLQLFASAHEKELQHNLVMTVPYGEASYGERVHGGTARYAADLGAGVDVEATLNYTQRRTDFTDTSQWVYDWYGNRVAERRPGGETRGTPTDQTLRQDALYARLTVHWALAATQDLRLSSSLLYATRTGDDALRGDGGARDPLNARRDLTTLVTGLEYEARLCDEALSSILFVKDYVYDAQSEEPVPGGASLERDVSRHRLGAGASSRLRLWPGLHVKASYEYATRLPRPDEVFGDGVLVVDNLNLVPEVSHNANLGPRLELHHAELGALTVDVNAFLRDSDRLIVLLGNERTFSNQNVYRARGIGLENALHWSSPARHLSLEGALTWQSVRNASTSGTFGDFEGDRIPNRPYLFGSWGARLRLTSLLGGADTLEPYYDGRYVHEFYRGWESQGSPQYKAAVGSQITHAAGVSWNIERYPYRGSVTLESDNVTDAKVFDHFGVQRPGRAFYLKLTGEL